jgi:hypothetical protein
MSLNKEKAPEVEQKVIKIRITITSTDVKKIEKGMFIEMLEFKVNLCVY